MGMMEKRISKARKAPSKNPQREGAKSKRFGGDAQFGDIQPFVAKNPRAIVIPHPPDEAINGLVHRATEIIGDRDKALRWMGTPVRGLGFATPVSLLGTSEGAQRVEDILTQMEHGVW
jgi:hypothetical protein